jgi:fructose 5-dehydrogenase cytochrome subunit
MSGRSTPVSLLAVGIAAAAVAAVLLLLHGGPSRSAAPEPAAGTLTQRGQELADANGCIACHSPQNGPALSGNMVGAWLAPNITPDPVSGIGGWSRAEVLRYLRTGSVPGRGQAAGPMAAAVEALKNRSDADLEALAGWLASQLPARDPADQVAAWARGKPLPVDFPETELRGPPPTHPDPAQTEARLFSGSCASCHMPNGAGTPDGHFPSLFHNSAVGRRNPANLLAAMLYGVQRTTSGGSVFMPGFDGSAGMPGGLDDPELATLANFVLTRFGDPESAKITAKDIEAARAGR